MKYDPHSAAFRSNPFPAYAEFREKHPVYEQEEGRWVLFRYEDARAILTDDKLMYKCPEKMLRRFPDEGWYHEYNLNSMAFKDPPEHTKIRKSVARAFIPKELEQLRPLITEVARSLLDGLPDPTRFDLAREFAFYLPLYVICEMMEVPNSDRELFRRCANGLVNGLEPFATEQTFREANDAAQDLYEYLSVLVEQRRRNTGNDLISRLISYGTEDKLSHDEIVHNASFLLSAGHETTSSLIGNGILALNQFPEQQAFLQTDPGLIGNSVEEFLRFNPPLHAVPRFSREDLTLNGVTIPKGSMVTACIASANRDPAMFPKPDTLDITRPNAKKHLSFSGGIHVCLGHLLARLEGAIAFQELFSRFKKIELDGEPVLRDGASITGVVELPVVTEAA